MKEIQEIVNIWFKDNPVFEVKEFNGKRLRCIVDGKYCELTHGSAYIGFTENWKTQFTVPYLLEETT